MGSFDKLVERCLDRARVYAKVVDNDTNIRISHVILSILKDEKENFVIAVLKELNVDINILIESITYIRNGNISPCNDRKNKPKPTKTLNKILNYAKTHPLKLDEKYESSIEDIFYAAMHVENELSELLNDFALEPKTFKETAHEVDLTFNEYFDEDVYYEYVENSKSITKKIPEENEILDKFCTNLSKLAIENKLDPCFGRDEELSQIYRILCRTRKSNPILIGKAGVGKTNLVEGLAYNIVKNNVPQKLQNKTIYSLNLNSVIAGTKYRGMFEERVQKILDELSTNPNNIIFIDEVHTIMGAGSAEGTTDLSNILKPYIARSGFQIIGATTLDEYKKYFEKDKALKRRFGEVMVDEPSVETCVSILNKLKPSFEQSHSVKYTDDAIKACVELSNKYITYRALPDKAIDLLDDVAVRKRLDSQYTSNLNKLQDKYYQLEDIKKRIIETKSYENAEMVKKESNTLLLDIKREKAKINKENNRVLQITVEDIKALVEEVTNIPISNGGIDINNLKETLQENIIGQNHAIDEIVKTLMINNLNLDDGDKPIGSFMFVGYSGVGKTQLTRELTKSLFGDDKHLVRIDCSEYTQAFEVTKLIGSPAGYVGYEEGGVLTESVKRKPFSVVLFDEVEKAHNKLFDILLQVLGEGRLTDNKGETIDFKNTIIVLTSNIGTKNIKKPKVGFGSKEEYDSSEIDKAIKKRFRPEFVNRLDNIIHFNTLEKEALMKILNLEVEKLQKQIETHGCKLKITPKAKTLLVDGAFIPENGARALKRKINSSLKIKIAEKILKGEKMITIGVNDVK